MKIRSKILVTILILFSLNTMGQNNALDVESLNKSEQWALDFKDKSTKD